MSNHEQPTPSHPKSDVRNTVGKDKQTPQGSARTTSAVDLEEFCEKHYEKLLPIMADKYEYEQRKKEKLEEVKARLDFGGTRRKGTRAQYVFTSLKRERSRSPRHDHKNKTRRESTVFKRLGSRGRSVSAYSDSRQESLRYTENHSESEDSEGGAGGLSHESRSPASRMTTSPNLGYDDLREAFLKNYLQQKKCIRDPIVLHNIKQRDGESTEDFIQRYKSESENVKGAPECMRISGFVHGITNPELIKRFHEKNPKTVDEMMQVATSFLQGQEGALNQERKKAPPAWKHQEGGHRQNFKKGGGFRSQHKQVKRLDRFTLLTKTPKEILALEKEKFKTPPSMTTPVEKRNANKFCEFYGEVGHNTDECNDLRKQIKDMLKDGKLSHIIRELKQTSGKDQQKKKGETSRKKKPQAILMIQSRQKVIRDKKSNGPSYNLANRVQRRNKMATGTITLLVKIEDDEYSMSTWMDFMVVRSTSPHNEIIGRPGLRKIQAVPSTTHGMIKFPVTGGILTLRSSKIIPIECAMVSGPEDQPLPVNKVKEERVKVEINLEHPEQTVMIGSNLTEKARVKLCNLLQRSLDKKRGQTVERNIAINDEVSKLVAAGIMKEVHYHDWLSNPVMVKKNENSWRMCVDFKNLNKACPKDGYPLPEIDWKVESLYGFPFKCFPDAYKGYYQIQMAEEDEEKTMFITNQGIFCYTKMTFGLRNAGATYQRLVDKTFQGQIGRNLEVYVDDLVIKSHTEDEVVRDIEETFKTLRKINIKLNPKKCTFEVEEGMFLGYQVNTKGIKICPDKSAFRQMKELIAKLPILTAPEENKELVIYLAAPKEAVSVVLMTEREAKQMPIYFVSRALRGPEVNYTSMEKLVLALVHASKRLRRPRISVKGQVLADFIVERLEEEDPDDSAKEGEPLPVQWTLFTDGSSCAEYEALISGLRIAEKMGVQNLQVNVDSKLVANQVNGAYVAKETDMIKYLEKVKTLASDFHEFSIKQVPRNGNKKADALSKMASTSFAHLSKQVLVEELKEKSVNEIEVLVVVEEEGDSWMTPIHEYLTDETLPAERKKARAIKRKSQRFAIINGILYKKSFLGPWLRCVGPSQANYVLREIHEGSCSMHAGTRSVVAKALRIGYYWPTMHKDARALIKACQECQVHKPVPRNPQERLNPITSPWPFYKWGIDIAGPFPEGPGKVKFLIVAMDYFTKWIEAKPVATITGNQVKKFVWENIVCRFGLPGEIISDNGKQFRDNPFKDWCEKLCIQQHFASVKHPQTNGLVERANRSLGEGIKARLGKDNKNWMEEVSHVLWAHRTMIKTSNGDTPFSLTYGTEAVIPAEIRMPTFRTKEVDVTKNDEALEINLELLEEKREQAAIREAKSKRQMEKYYNTKVRNTSFKPGDLVYRSNEASRVEDTGKLGPKWEGPYEVT
ncbi:reverse transcriptase domain-containing protein [Tanacetum coccineum]